MDSQQIWTWVGVCILVLLGFLILHFIVFRSIKMVIALVVLLVIFSIGFFWLPGKIESVTSGESTVTAITDGVIHDFDNSGIPEAMEQGKTTWQKAWDDLFHKQ